MERGKKDIDVKDVRVMKMEGQSNAGMRHYREEKKKTVEDDEGVAVCREPRGRGERGEELKWENEHKRERTLTPFFLSLQFLFPPGEEKGCSRPARNVPTLPNLFLPQPFSII